MTTLGGPPRSSTDMPRSSSGIRNFLLGRSSSNISRSSSSNELKSVVANITTSMEVSATESPDSEEEQQGNATTSKRSLPKSKKKNKNRKKKATSNINPVEIYKKTATTNESYSSSDADDYSDSEDEGKEGYRKGGYHPVTIGETYKERYQVVRKLGWGHFSTVWLCQDVNHANIQVALKVVKSASHYTEAAEDEIKLLTKIAEGDPENKKCCVKLLDSFYAFGPNGKHVAMAFEVLGSNLLDLIKKYNYEGIPIHIVKSICKQVLIGLDYLHTQCGIIHTDLKPENVLLHITLPKQKSASRILSSVETDAQMIETTFESSLSIQSQNQNTTSLSNDFEKSHGFIETDIDENNPLTYRVKIADFGNACWEHQHFSSDIQTRQYRAPEVILGSKYSTSVDMWSMGCMTFELATGDLLFEPKNGSNYDKNDDHLGQMIELLGKIPKGIASSGKFFKDFFNRSGELKYIKELRPWSLEDVLQEKYKWNAQDAKDMASFILPMLEYNIDKRATAAEMLRHEWIRDVPPYL